jgi:retron-type reverse transcriptase
MFSFSHVSHVQIANNMKKINVSKGAGYDCIAPKILKIAADNLVPYITCLINDMFNCRVFPEQLKRAEICPLHKKGSTLDKANYRPVSILTSISKLFEKEIDHQLKTLSSNVFAKSLSAYRANHSTQHVLLQFTEAVKGFLDDKLSTGAVLTDLSKAFDCLPHDLIIAKLHAYNVSKDALVLLASYLRGRSQRVKIANQRSEWRYIYKGVPQGSIVGPALFNFFINDLLFPSSEYDIANYADDTTIFTSAESKELLATKLTDATSTVIQWFNLNGMQANPAKFQYIIFGSGTVSPKLEINDTVTLESCDTVKLY